ncbi:latrophilin Cirl-like isoform X2 [Centruroides vittatus]|uniref:latrophilin Cirl-like isoform X2 n=1 Tax=Centruroides vittatus TaxID=120091 RepID=UPI003510D1A3
MSCMRQRWKTAVTSLLLLLGLVHLIKARRGMERPKYRTAYACEGSELHISCDEGHLIHLIRANYGRFSISICNEHGSLDWSVDCTSHRSYYVVYESCSLKGSCTLPASSAVFNDPCPDTRKYLEVHYFCMPDSTSTTTSTTMITTTTSTTTRPPIIIPVTKYQRPTSTSSSVISDGDSSRFKPTNTSTTLSHHESSYIITGSEKTISSTSQTPTKLRSSSTESFRPSQFVTESSNSERTRSPDSTNVDKFKGMCSPVHSRTLFWNWTKAGEVAVQRCPGGAIGEAKWSCSYSDVTWTPASPDLSQCSSVWVDNLKNRIERGDSVVSIAAELGVITRNKVLYGGDVSQTAQIMHRLVEKMADKVQDVPDDKQRHQVLQELLESVTEVSSNLLEEDHKESWGDLSSVEQKHVASMILENLEQSGWMLATAHKSRYHFRRVEGNILVSVRLVEAWAVSEVSFPSPEDVYGTSWSSVQDSLVLPTQSLLGSATNGVVKVVFLAYNRVEDFMNHDNLGEITSDSDSNITRIINSRVIAATLGSYHMVKLAESVTIYFKHIQEENVTNPQCVFWDLDTREWSPEGCWVKSYNFTHTVCACDHLTNFALMMDVSATKINHGENIMLKIFTYIGCSVSMLFLILTLIFLQMVKNLKNDHITIRKNFCICIFIVEAVLIGGIDQMHFKILCSVLAGLVHYFLLASFVWTFLDSFQLHITLVNLYETNKSRMKWYYLAGYGLPLLVVVISVIVDPSSYGTESYCSLDITNFFVFSFVGPAIACVLVTLFFLILTMGKVRFQTNSANSKNKQTKITSANDEDALLHVKCHIMLQSRCGVVLLIILVANWTIYLLHLYQGTAVMAYVFTALNCLQGIIFFIFFIIKDEQVRRSIQKSMWRNERISGFLRRGKARGRGSEHCPRPNGIVTVTSNTPGQYSLPHLNWNSPKELPQHPTNIEHLIYTTPGHQSIATLNILEREGTHLSQWYSDTEYSNTVMRILETEDRRQKDDTTKTYWPPPPQTVDFTCCTPSGHSVYNIEHFYESIDEYGRRAPITPSRISLPRTDSYYCHGEHYSETATYSENSQGSMAAPSSVSADCNVGILQSMPNLRLWNEVSSVYPPTTYKYSSFDDGIGGDVMGT